LLTKKPSAGWLVLIIQHKILRKARRPRLKRTGLTSHNGKNYLPRPNDPQVGTTRGGTKQQKYWENRSMIYIDPREAAVRFRIASASWTSLRARRRSESRTVDTAAPAEEAERLERAEEARGAA
jgi:hypothetical protein